MPIIYLSPSTQEFNPYDGGGNEEYYMNLLADAMEPYLTASGIRFTRNTPDMTAASSIAASNQGNYDFHLALHSNASNSGNVRGTEFYYFPTSENGKRFAELAAENFQLIYPLPDRVRAIPTTTLGEVRRVKAPGVLIEVEYHDNPEGAQWIRDNIEAMAANIAFSLTEYFGIPFNTPQPIFTATVATRGSNLNIRYAPTTSSNIVGSIPNGAEVTVYATIPDWAVVGYNGTVGYVSSQYLQY